MDCMQKEPTNMPFINRTMKLCRSAYAASSNLPMCPRNAWVTTTIPNEVTLATIAGNAISHTILDSIQILPFRSTLLDSSANAASSQSVEPTNWSRTRMFSDPKTTDHGSQRIESGNRILQLPSS
ncbi:unnamed protein product [Dovyalis caffra]|uniref:Uncharacterized protein n=1 Tax=Dovyalis caffra TaxID=77055 RepID=A0AAV1RLV1_9ROSI|nr:unnamed protein product [Dovyalis caffra]